mmetsp:Transcript_28060/g.84082  ORF Transcript_28060/g.84082 Transcript_28060/m.84082 type:complete len:243 (+) Transcript_28060:508-1236(+)
MRRQRPVAAALRECGRRALRGPESGYYRRRRLPRRRHRVRHVQRRRGGGPQGARGLGRQVGRGRRHRRGGVRLGLLRDEGRARARGRAQPRAAGGLLRARQGGAPPARALRAGPEHPLWHRAPARGARGPPRRGGGRGAGGVRGRGARAPAHRRGAAHGGRRAGPVERQAAAAAGAQAGRVRRRGPPRAHPARGAPAGRGRGAEAVIRQVVRCVGVRRALYDGRGRSFLVAARCARRARAFP